MKAGKTLTSRRAFATMVSVDGTTTRKDKAMANDESGAAVEEQPEEATEDTRLFRHARVAAMKVLDEDALADAIANGHVLHADAEVTVRKDKSPTGKDETRSFDDFIAVDDIGINVLSGGKMEAATPRPEDWKGTAQEWLATEAGRPGAADDYNYGRDLRVRQQVRQALEADLEGPDKFVKNSISDLLKRGLYLKEDLGTGDIELDAAALVVRQAKRAGKANADYVLPASVLAELKK